MTIRFTTVAEAENKKELTVLFDNLKTLQVHRDEILKNPEFYKVRIEGTGIFAMYAGSARLFLGDLIQLWESAPWKDGTRYYYSVGGSPLSGMSFCHYWDEKEGFGMVKNNPSFGILAKPAWGLINNLPKMGNVIEINERKMTQSNLTIDDLLDKIKT